MMKTAMRILMNEAETGEWLERRSALEILTWAVQRFAPRLTCAIGFGAEGCVLVDLIGRHHLPIDLFTLDTELLFPETYALWRALESRYALTIRAVRPVQTVADQAVTYGPNLWEHSPDRCCELRKVRPLGEALSGFDAWITSIRREQTSERAGARGVEWDARSGLVKVNPLVGWSRAEVWSHLREHQVPYNPLHDRGYPSIGCAPCTSPVRDGEDARAGRWRGHRKTECGLHLPVAGDPPIAIPLIRTRTERRAPAPADRLAPACCGPDRMCRGAGKAGKLESTAQ